MRRNLRRSKGTYPDNWKDGSIQKTVKHLANYRCETCFLTCNKEDNWSEDGQRTLFGCHHIDHDRSNNDLKNIVFLCQRCHLDAHRHGWIPGQVLPIKWERNTPRWIIARKLPHIKANQLPLFRED